MSNKLPAYRLHKSTGQAVVTLNGKDFYLGIFDSAESHAAYDRLIAEWLAHGRQLPQVGTTAELTVLELCAAYLRFAEIYYSREGHPTSEYIAMRDVIKAVRRLYGELDVNHFGPIALKGVRQHWIERGLARRRINQLVNRTRRIFKWGVENEHVSPNILHGLQAVAPLKKGRTPARETQPIGPVPDAHVDAVVPLVSPQVAAMIQLQRLTGMRPGEAVILRPCDLDCTQHIWVYQPSRHKTDYRDITREIFLGPQAQDILRPFLDRKPTDFCFSPAEAEAERQARRRANRKTPLTPSQRARTPRVSPHRAKRARYDRDSYRRAIDYAIKKAGIPHWHPHQLRHNCGTRIRREFGLDVAQVVLGHQTADVTQVYAAADRARAVSAIARIG